MARKFIILLSLCCAVLCAIVGFLSQKVDGQADKRESERVVTSCKDFLAGQRIEAARVMLTEFVPGKYLCELDQNLDEQCDEIVAPLFPDNVKRMKYGYKAAIVCFKNVKSKEEFKELVADGKLDADFWPSRQELNPIAYSELAQKYKNLDFENSAVLHYGFESSKPVLGEATLKFSMIAGGVALTIAFLALFSGLFVRKEKEQSLGEFMEQRPNNNRAGLPQI